MSNYEKISLSLLFKQIIYMFFTPTALILLVQVYIRGKSYTS